MFFFQETNKPEKETNKLEVGDIVYFVGEHLYYPDEEYPSESQSHFVEKEYYVYEGIVKGIYTYPGTSRKPDCCILYGLDGEKKGSLHYPRLSDFGVKFFHDRESACALAEKTTDNYEQRGLGACLHERLRRPWRKQEDE